MPLKHQECKGLGHCMYRHPHVGGGGRGPIGRSSGGCLIMMAALAGIMGSLLGLAVAFLF